MLSDVAALPSATRLLEEITTLVSRAAAAILAIDIDHVAKRLKSDLSPVTAADEVAQAVILEGLPHVLPGIPVISEEASEQWPALEPAALRLCSSIHLTVLESFWRAGASTRSTLRW